MIRPVRNGCVEVSVPADARLRRPGVVVHRRSLTAEDVTTRDRIPVTSPVCTLVDLAARVGRDEVEAAINEADKRDLVDPERCGRRSTSFRGGREWESCARSSIAAPSPSPTRCWSAASCALHMLPDCRRRRRGASSTVTGPTSSGHGSAWWWRPTGCGTTARRRSRRRTAGATSVIRRRASGSFASRMRRCGSSPSMSYPSCRRRHIRVSKTGDPWQTPAGRQLDRAARAQRRRS